MSSDADALPPRQLTPAFWGCFDWHSAVHGHWLLARYARAGTNAAGRPAPARRWPSGLTAENIRGEVRCSRAKGRDGQRAPVRHGLAAHPCPGAPRVERTTTPRRGWSRALEPLGAARRAAHAGIWLPKLTHPVRSGEHGQTAFAMGVWCLDWARAAGDAELGRADRRAGGAPSTSPIGGRAAPLRAIGPRLPLAEPRARRTWLRRVLPRGKSSQRGSPASCPASSRARGSGSSPSCPGSSGRQSSRTSTG